MTKEQLTALVDVLILVSTAVIFLPVSIWLARKYLGGGMLLSLIAAFSSSFTLMVIGGYLMHYFGGLRQWSSVPIGLVSTVGIAFAMYIVYRQITRPLRQITAVMTRLAVGDLSQTSEHRSQDELGQLAEAFRQMVEYQRRMAAAAHSIAVGNLAASVAPQSEQDELGLAFGNMQQRLQQVVADIVCISKGLALGDLRVVSQAEYAGDLAQIQTALAEALTGLNNTIRQTGMVVKQVDQGVDQVRDVSQSLAAGASEQSTAAEEVSANLEETGVQITSNAENAGLANQLAGETAALAQAGQTKMKDMAGAMGAIAESSRAISKIIKVIDEIAFQTNLLALNAAVEAARAGQQGRGFAVVAQEVRNLAVRSAKAAKETAELIEGSSRRVEEGVAMSGETGTALTEIVQKVLKVRDLVAEIAVASDEQAKGIKQVNQAMGQVSQGAQSTSAQGEELASTAEELSNLANTLRQEVNRFKLRAETGLEPQIETRFVSRPAAAPQLKGAKGTRGADKAGSLDRDERGYANF